MFNNKIILITGGTGSFGSAFVDYLIKKKLILRKLEFLVEIKKNKMILERN